MGDKRLSGTAAHALIIKKKKGGEVREETSAHKPLLSLTGGREWEAGGEG